MRYVKDENKEEASTEPLVREMGGKHTRRKLGISMKGTGETGRYLDIIFDSGTRPDNCSNSPEC